MQAAFKRHGIDIEVVKENMLPKDGKNGIYLGGTEFARQHGIKVDVQEGWSYYQKTFGKDLVIAGREQHDKRFTLAGTVKGVCDFLKEYAGTRFLFSNTMQTWRNRDEKYTFNPDGTIRLDTRSIAFLPLQQIVIPEKLDVKKVPYQLYNTDACQCETFYYLANNLFPWMQITGIPAGVNWLTVIPIDQYAKTHPEYFALLPDGRRSCEFKHSKLATTPYCVTSPGVQDLMFSAAEKLIQEGHMTITITSQDGYASCRCSCEDCTKLFNGIPATDFFARGKSGKLWQAYFAITNRIAKKYPNVKVVLLAYQDNPVLPEIITRFPNNIILRVQYASQKDFDGLKGIEVPGGLFGFEESFNGFGQAGPFIPERTPEHMAKLAQAIVRNRVICTTRDGNVIGFSYGLNSPAYYVYGRMLDNPEQDWKTIYKEFCDAAFGVAGMNWEAFVRSDESYKRKVEVPALCGDSSKATRLLGWTPKTSFKQLVEMMVEEDMKTASEEKKLGHLLSLF
jgi:hypothetical protein